MAKEVSSPQEIRSAVAETAQRADDLKILQTGIIDFEAGEVTKPPQFDLDSLKLMVELANEKGLKTFAHCSGLKGLEVAVEAGVNSIEHGFFMSEAILDKMAEKKIAWVPTFSPVHSQWEHPEVVGWSKHTVANLRRILDDHLRHVEMAFHQGVQLVAGSDAGGLGVTHGKALIDELNFFLEAGLPMQEVLVSATSRPRQLWNSEPANIIENSSANFIVLGASPFDHPEALSDVKMVFSQGLSTVVNPSTSLPVRKNGQTEQNAH
jgi:imidazolonepropionase-like amidohydrolase